MQTAFPSGHGKGRNTFFTVVCYTTKNENTDILVNPGSADPVSGVASQANVSVQQSVHHRTVVSVTTHMSLASVFGDLQKGSAETGFPDLF